MGRQSYIQVVPGRAGGGSFTRKKNYIAKKEFAYRMCARRPTSAMPKPCLCCERAFCCSMVVMWPVLMQCWLMWCAPMWFDAVWLLVLCHVTWCNAMSCDVRSRVELSSVVPCNGMEPKMPLVLRSHCVFEVVIQSTILYYKALLCTAEYYSSTTLYYTVLQRATPVLHCTTKRHSWLMSVAYETSFTMRGATGVILQCHEILHLPRKKTVMIDPRHIWNVTYNERSNRNHNPSSPNTAPATQNECHQWSASHMKRHFQCAEQVKSPFKLTNYCACHAKWISWLIRVAYETSFRMRGATRVTPHLHQILRLPRKMNLMIDPPHIWNVI